MTTLAAASVGIATIATSPTAFAQAPPAGPAQAVIVLMKAQHPDLQPRTQAQARAQAVRTDQQPIVADLTGHGATDIHQMSTLSAISAKADPAEIARLQANPQVAAVVPDLTILPGTAANTGGAKTGKISQEICPPDPSKPMLEPESLDITHTESSDPKAPQAHSLATGKGVKIAFLADGVDINNPDFIRPDGSKVFFDYQDFSGDGTNDNSGGDEAFGDASTLAAQGNRTYDLSTELPYSGLPKGCTVRIRGFAPGAQLAGIKVFGQYGTTTSAFVRGIDYAVSHDKVDILSESFGGNPYPDTTNDPITLANRAALDAGVTVVASSGDSGVSGTVGSPASDPREIAVGATTAYRLVAEAMGYRGWVNNNITALSSGGPTLGNKLVDLVAPGMAGMADCTPDPSKWSSCTSLTEPFGGTSQSAPDTAGAAALVIQAYGDTHGGKRPSPALVKSILTGTATDLHTPAAEQGAGLLNSYAAVLAARSVSTSDGAGVPNAASGIIPSVDQLDLTGKAGGSVQHTSVTLTNTSDQPRKITTSSRTPGRQTYEFTTTEQVTGATMNPVPPEGTTAAPPFTFQVPANTPLLGATMTWPGTQNSGPMVLLLFDPQGRLVQQSYDYGFTNHQYIDVHDPTPGTWTAKILWGNGRGHFQNQPATPGSYRGPISVRITGQQWADAGITTASKTIPAHGSARFDLTVPLPAAAGDDPASVQFDSPDGTHFSLPIARRTMVPTNGTPFTATITGGVGRSIGQSLGYAIQVPAGHKSLTVDLTAQDPDTTLNYFLVSPDGQILASDTNQTEQTWNQPNSTTPTRTASLTADAPMAGQWQLIVSLPNPVSGKEFSEQAVGTATFDKEHALAVGLPDNAATKIKSGTSVTASIQVTNTGAAGEYFFLDPRLTNTSDLTLTPISGTSEVTLPLDTSGSVVPTWIVPPHTSGIEETSTATLPVDVDLEYFAGDPEVFAKSGGKGTVTDGLTANQIAIGAWSTNLGQAGPFPGTASEGVANVSLAANTQQFDPWASSSAGDQWQQAVGGKTGTPQYVAPGVTSNINLTLSPTAPVGTVVHGVVYVDTYNPLVGNGSELLGIPYTYTVG